MDETERVRRAKAGDESSFAALVEDHREALERFVAARIPRTLARKIATEDVLQDALVTAFARLGDFECRGEGAFRAWLMRIVEFKLREAVRRFAGTARRGGLREISRGARRDTHQFAADQSSPSEHAVGRELEVRVHDALERLLPDYRRLLTLVQVEHQSLAEAAILIERSYEATKKLYGRAVTALARELGSGGESSA
jgi:RNA polymerase sigma factor (sigma-70 family)